MEKMVLYKGDWVTESEYKALESKSAVEERRKSESEQQEQPESETQPKTPRKRKKKPAESSDEKKEEYVESGYFCDVCGSKLRYLQYTCRKCKTVCDWRGTDAETDEDIVICPECGAYCGEGELAHETCPNCGFGG